MTASMPVSQTTAQGAAARSGVRQEMQHLTGVLWYEMLSGLSGTGMDDSALGVGGGNFQSMFLWNLSQNDFGKYDSGLIEAALHQVGGQAAAAPSVKPVATMAALAAKGVDASTLDAATAPEAPGALARDSASASGLLAQATNFTKAIWPQITAAAQALGVPPVAVLAQTALETGWGASTPGHNLFGIKAGDGEAGSVRATHEMVDGVLTPQQASFRDYTSLSGSVSDYVGLIQSAYQDATGQGTVAGFAQALQAGGYATDENYAVKIEQIARSPIMAKVLQAVGGTMSSSSDGATP
ncbi:glycoside hydrolase family 73 protein [Acidocella sp.]|uniref:glycoside hydrolase family 73 protein n=1 Tax=Acidocella sp. TaxID=50710 RepID=UPI003D02684E